MNLLSRNVGEVMEFNHDFVANRCYEKSSGVGAKMKVITGAVMAMWTLAGAAQAGDWRVVGLNDSSVTLIDASSIRTTSSVGTTAWIGLVHIGEKDDGVDYTMIRTDFLCGSGMMRLVHTYKYRSDGSLVTSFPMTTQTMQPPPPDSVGAEFIRAVCEGAYSEEAFGSLTDLFSDESKAEARARRGRN